MFASLSQRLRMLPWPAGLSLAGQGRWVLAGALSTAAAAVVAFTTLTAMQILSPAVPKDYEDCAAAIDPQLTGAARQQAVQDCDERFPARRKAGGGYSYFDFLQNRSFDVAGPKPTADELQRMDEEYKSYLERERENARVTAEKRLEQIERELALTLPKMPPTGRPGGPALRSASLAPPLVMVPLPPRRPKPPRVQTCQSFLTCAWADLKSSMAQQQQPSPRPRRDTGRNPS